MNMGSRERLKRLRVTRNCVFILTVVFLAFTSACGKSSETGNENPSFAPLEREYIELPFQSIALEDTLEPLQIWIEENKSTQQNKAFKVDEKTYVVILLGEQSASGYDVKINEINDVKFIQDGNISEGYPAVFYEMIKLQNENTDSPDATYPFAIAEVEGMTDTWVEFSRSLTEEELEKMMGVDTPNQSGTNHAQSNSNTSTRAAGGGTAELVRIETLLEEGKVE